jgi:NAD(P)-dependent dehydrogenase (short-subunit alcohol dehydrogenase family)
VKNGARQQPEAIAAIIAFLCSARVGEVMGQRINVDGGRVMPW